MSKIALDSIQGGFNLDKINANFEKIETELNTRVLYRDNPYGEINAMQGPLDLNGFPILNASNMGSGGGGGASDAAHIMFAPTGSIESDTVQDAIMELAGDVPEPAINFPRPNGVAAQIGTSERYAREDHVHVGGGSGAGGGGDAISSGQVYAYQRSLTAPTGTPGPVEYDFGAGAITTPTGNDLLNGWTKTIPSGSNPLYVTVASASGIGTSDTIATNEWSTPVVLAANGANGTNGLSVATVYLYKRATTNTAPAVPNANVTWQFTPPMATGLTNGWSSTVPDSLGGDYLFVTTATAVSNTSTDTITPTEWATPQLMAKNGSSGNIGPKGADGTRGTVTIAVGGNSTWSDAAANTAILSSGYGSPQNRDIVTLYGTGTSTTKYYQSGSWLPLTAYINGNLLVSGTVSGNTIAGGTMTSTVIRFGGGHTPSNNAFEITTSGAVWADNIFGGIFYADNYHYTASASVYGLTSNNSAKAGVEGIVAATNSNSGTAGLYGHSAFSGSAGLVGPNMPYDFYANGSGTNYGPFTGAHDALVKGEGFELGDIVIDVTCVSRAGLSNTIFHVTKSMKPAQKGATGVVASKARSLNYVPAAFVLRHDDGVPVPNEQYDEAASSYEILAMNAVGEGQINVCGEGGDIQIGDYIITSSVPGKGMKQEDDIHRSYTVARAREACTFDNPSEQKQIACVYLCG